MNKRPERPLATILGCVFLLTVLVLTAKVADRVPDRSRCANTLQAGC